MSVDDFSKRGGCACSQLGYHLNSAPLAIYVCHCTNCQTLSGSAFSIGVVVRSADVKVLGHWRHVSRTLGSGLVTKRVVCPDCGVWVFGGTRMEAVENSEMRVVRGGTFDDSSWIWPATHYWTRSAQPWVIIPSGAKTYDTQP